MTARPSPGTHRPATGRWLLDPATADVAFSGRATRLSPLVRARFTGVRGCVVAGPDGTTVEVEIDVRTMTSDNRAYDELLAAVDPFSVEQFPGAHYRGSAGDWREGAATVHGALALRGVVQPVVLRARHSASRLGDRLVVQAEGDVDPTAFGVRLDLPGAGLLVPRRLRLAIRVEAVAEQAVLVAA